MKAQKHTAQEIAKLAGVSLDQAVKVMLGQPGVEEAARRKVYEVMQKVGYLPTQTQKPVTTSAGVIGIVCPGRLSNDYVGAVAAGITETAKLQGYETTVHAQGRYFEDDMVQLLAPGGVDGIIMIVPYHSQQLIALCHRHNRPYVLVDYQENIDFSNVPTVEVKNRQAIIQAMNHLFALGHKRIAFITGILRMVSALERLEGYKDALAEAGILFDPDLVGEGTWDHRTGYEHSKQFLQLAFPPTAIVASNDLMAFGAYQAIREAGLEIGKHVSVIGVDDIDMAATVSPTLTTVRQPSVDLGKIAAEMLIQQLNGETPTLLHAQMDTELIIRQSTGRARA